MCFGACASVCESTHMFSPSLLMRLSACLVYPSLRVSPCSMCGYAASALRVGGCRCARVLQFALVVGCPMPCFDHCDCIRALCIPPLMPRGLDGSLDGLSDMPGLRRHPHGACFDPHSGQLCACMQAGRTCGPLDCLTDMPGPLSSSCPRATCDCALSTSPLTLHNRSEASEV